MSWDVCPAATVVTQPYGCTSYSLEWWRPDCASGFFHAGVDISGPGIHGQPVYATRAGRVVANQDPAHRIRICPQLGGGTELEPYLGPNCVIVAVAEPGRTVYLEHGHLMTASVAPGQPVSVGQLLGLVGTQGSSCGDHLHLEARSDGPRQGPPWTAVLDPSPYLNGLQEDDMTPEQAAQLANVQDAVARILGLLSRGEQYGPDGQPLPNTPAYLSDRLDNIDDASNRVLGLLSRGEQYDSTGQPIAGAPRYVADELEAISKRLDGGAAGA